MEKKPMTLDEFNNTLLGALKPGTPKSKLFQIEADAAKDLLFCELLDLVELINDGKPYEEQLMRCNNVARNMGDILDKLEEAKAKEAEGKKE